jgi:hypothetical protein
MKKQIIIVFIMLCFAQSLFGIHEDAGTKAFQFLKVPIGPRGIAMGGAYQGLSDDELAPFWNPAGLPQTNDMRLSVTYLNYFVGYHGGGASFLLPLDEKATLGIFSKFAGAGDFVKTDREGNEIGEFGSYDVLLGISYGIVQSEILNWGINVKIISETIDDYSSQAIAGDVGILHQTPNPNLKIGVVAKNLGQQISKFDKEAEELPIFFALGFAYSFDKGVVTADINKPIDGDFYATFGVEGDVGANFKLRGGYRTNAGDWNVGSDIDFISGITAGVGFAWEKYHFDYAINSYGELGFIHQLAVRYMF